jgi:hypothetical protein
MDESLDLRGKESNIFRLWGFDREALLHMVSYRILIAVSIPLAAIIVWASLTGTHQLVLEAVILLVGALLTPQLFGVFKVVSIFSTGGRSFGRLNESYLSSTKDKSNQSGKKFFDIFPYAGIAIWILILIVVGIAWFR